MQLTISDLSSVPFKILDSLRIRYVVLSRFKHANLIASFTLQLVEVRIPYFGALIVCEVIVVNGHVDAGLDCLIRRANAVSREEEDSIAILYSTHERCYQIIALQILRLSRREIDVSFINQKD